MMPLSSSSVSEEEKMRALPWNLVHGGLTSIFFLWTFGGSIFVLFLSELGLPKGQIGTLLSFFPFSGLIALVFAPAATRIGRKRVFMACYGSRYFVIANLLLLPWVLERAGYTAGIIFLFVVMAVVALLRAMGETAYYPWSQEFIPNGVRGRFAAVSTVVGTFASGVALLVGGNVIGSGTGLGRYLWLLGIGSLIGLAGIIVMKWVPGGAPVRVHESQGAHFANMVEALRDPNLIAYLKGMGGVMVGSVLLTSFLPLYVKEQIGLPVGTVVILDTAVMAGGVISSIFWGWAADRIGSRPVMMSSLLLGTALPVGWILMPRQMDNPVLWCAVLYFAYGVISSGSAIGAGRLLFNGVIPEQKSTAYTAIYYAWMGLTGGTAPLLAGTILSVSTGWRFSLGLFQIDGYQVLFLLALVLLLLGVRSYARVRPDDVFSMRAALRRILSGVFQFKL
jgi:MFS family permease